MYLIPPSTTSSSTSMNTMNDETSTTTTPKTSIAATTQQQNGGEISAARTAYSNGFDRKPQQPLFIIVRTLCNKKNESKQQHMQRSPGFYQTCSSQTKCCKRKIFRDQGNLPHHMTDVVLLDIKYTAALAYSSAPTCLTNQPKMRAQNEQHAKPTPKPLHPQRPQQAKMCRQPRHRHGRDTQNQTEGNTCSCHFFLSGQFFP